MSTDTGLPGHEVERLLRQALAEDLATAGDLTTTAIFPPNATTSGRIVAREEGRIAGLGAALRVFDLLDGAVTSSVATADGEDAAAGATVATLQGSTRAILTGSEPA